MSDLSNTTPPADPAAPLPAHLPAQLPEMMRATRAGKWRSAILALLAVLALIGFQLIALPLVLDLLADVSGTPAGGATVRKVQWLFIGLCGIGLVTAGILIMNARQILRSGQAPANDFWLWRDTPIVRGVAARRLAWISIAAAIATMLVCIALTVFIFQTLEKIAPHALRPGVTILHQKSWQE